MAEEVDMKNWLYALVAAITVTGCGGAGGGSSGSVHGTVKLKIEDSHGTVTTVESVPIFSTNAECAQWEKQVVDAHRATDLKTGGYYGNVYSSTSPTQSLAYPGGNGTGPVLLDGDYVASATPFEDVTEGLMDQVHQSGTGGTVVVLLIWHP